MNSDYQFVNADTEELIAGMVSAYEEISGSTLSPASPDRLMILWAASVILQILSNINYTGNQNIPGRATGENLDALGELFYDAIRPGSKSATCKQEFIISEAQNTSVLIPSGTRVTDSNGALFWETVADGYIPIGSTSITLDVYCQTAGAVGNGYVQGQINTLVDLFPYYKKCENVSTSDGGSDRATDSQYYELMRASQDAYSTAGPSGAYIYLAKSVSTDIADVKAVSPMPGYVHIYTLMDDGTIASPTIKELILEACSDSESRPLTDFVSTEDPAEVSYNIDFTYYLYAGAKQSGAEMQQAVDAAVEGYIAWQSERLGRDINPSELIARVKAAGVKRIDLVEPVFTVLKDGKEKTVPEVAKLAKISVTSGGHEDE